MKRILICLLVFAMAGTCISCGLSKDKEAAEATTQAPEKSTQEEIRKKDISLDAQEYVKLGQYENLTVKVPALEVTDEEVEDRIKEELSENMTDIDITDRDDVRDGDFVDAEWTMKFDGVKNDDYSNAVEIEMGAHQLDFLSEDMDCDAALIGKEIGDTVTVTGTVDEDYEDTDIAGKEVEISIRINGLSRQELPKLTDAYARDYLGYETVREYKKAVREEIRVMKEESADDLKAQLLWKQILDNAEQIKDFPEDAVKDEVYNSKLELEEEAIENDMDVTEYLKMTRDMTLTEYAKEALKSRCVNDLLAGEYGLSVSDEELEEAIRIEVEEEFGSEEAYMGYNTREDVRDHLIYNKVMEKVMETAVFEDE